MIKSIIYLFEYRVLAKFTFGIVLITNIIACQNLKSSKPNQNSSFNSSSEKGLVSPFPTASQQTDIPGQFECRPPPAPRRDILLESMYAPGDITKPDPVRVQQRKEATLNIVTFTSEITRLSDLARTLKGPNREIVVSCMVDWWGSWARGEAFLGSVNQEGGYERKWNLVAWNLAYLRLFGGQKPTPLPKEIADWLRRITMAVQAEYPVSAPVKNNHFYWAALAIASSGVVLQDPDFFSWGMQEYRSGLAAVDQDGFLPNELKRGGQALHYHLFSASALTMLAALEMANGGGTVFSQADGALHRLVKTALNGISDPQPFIDRNGIIPGITLDNLNGRELVWLEAYAYFSRAPIAEPWLARLRPLRTIWLGGDLTRSFSEIQ